MSGPRPWMKFGPDRWQRDMNLRLCSAAARGLWIELICLMHKSEVYGHLIVNGKAPNDKQLSILTAIPLIDVANGLTELEDNGVFSRTDEGVIFSRGMVKDEERHVEASAFGQKGVAAKLRKQHAEKGPSRVPSSKPSSPPSSKESESEIPPIVPQGTKTGIPDDWKPLDFEPGSQSRRIVDGWDENRLAAEAEQFRAHHAAAKSRYSDWQKVWSTWVLNTEKFERRAPARLAVAPRSHIDIVLEEYADRKPQSQPKKRAGATQ